MTANDLLAWTPFLSFVGAAVGVVVGQVVTVQLKLGEYARVDRGARRLVRTLLKGCQLYFISGAQDGVAVAETWEAPVESLAACATARETANALTDEQVDAVMNAALGATLAWVALKSQTAPGISLNQEAVKRLCARPLQQITTAIEKMGVPP